MESASLSFTVDFDEEEEGSTAEGASRSGTLTDDDMTFDPEGAAASAAVNQNFADPIAPLPQRAPSFPATQAPRLPMPGLSSFSNSFSSLPTALPDAARQRESSSFYSPSTVGRPSPATIGRGASGANSREEAVADFGDGDFGDFGDADLEDGEAPSAADWGSGGGFSGASADEAADWGGASAEWEEGFADFDAKPAKPAEATAAGGDAPPSFEESADFGDGGGDFGGGFGDGATFDASFDTSSFEAAPGGEGD